MQLKFEKLKIKLNQNGNSSKSVIKPIFEVFVDNSNIDVKLGSGIGISCIDVGVKI